MRCDPGVIEGDLDQIVASILEEFSLSRHAEQPGWQQQAAELSRIIAADYRAAMDRLLTSREPPLRELIRRARTDFPDFNRQPIQFGRPVRQAIAARGIRLRMTARATSPGLRGFYHRSAGASPVIWVNLAHPPGAIAASLGHELGHWYRELLLAEPLTTRTHAFFNARFTDHLRSTEELFADVFPVLAAYPRSLALRLFPRRRGVRAGVEHVFQFDRTSLNRIRAHLTCHYGFDPSQSIEPMPRRVYYVASMLHFARLRRALLDIADL